MTVRTPAALPRAGRSGTALAILLAGLAAIPSARAQAPEAETSAAFNSAAARAQDADTVRTIVTEAQLLYERDRVKLSGYQYCSQAVSLAERGEFRESVRAAGKALMLAQQDGNTDLQALANRDIAIAYSYSGNLQQAEHYAQQALALSYRDPKIVAAPCNKVLGDVYARRGDQAKALDAYSEAMKSASDKFRPLVQLSMINTLIAAGHTDEAEKLLKELGDPGTANLKPLLVRTRGNLLLAQNKYAEALEVFRAGLKEASGLDATYQRLWLQEGMAKAYLGQGNSAQALAAYQEAMQLADTMRARFRSDEFKTGLFGNTQEIFEEAIALSVSQGDFEGALRISEKSRARALLDMIRERTAHFGEAATAKSVAPIGVDDVRKALADNEVIVEYHSLPDKTVVWVVRRSGIKGSLIAQSRKDLEQAVEKFRTSVIQIDRSAARTQGRALYDVLLRPVELNKGERLIIVPHGRLHYLPFQALSDGNSYLIQLFPITVAPSASLAFRATVAKKDVRARLVAFGNPDLGDAERELPGAQREVQTISGMFAQPRLFFRKDANKATFKANAGASNVLHVAAHAEVDTLDPIKSRVLLSPSSADNGQLEAREIFDLDLTGVSLVTLSACQSGLGNVADGDEVIGFPRSFLSAGASGLIVSLWPVSDDSTELLMSTLYKELRAGKSAQDAMQAAQLAVLKNRKFSQPFYWAPFNLIGNWRLTVDVSG